MNLNSRISKLEKIQKGNKDIVIVTYIPDFEDPNYVIVEGTGREAERITRIECQHRIAKAKAKGIPICELQSLEEAL